MITPEVLRELNALQAGRNVTVGEFVLETSGTTTTVSSQGCSTSSAVLPFPKDAGAAAEIGGGTMFIVPGKQQFVVTHAASASPARTFRYAVFTGVKQL